MTINIVLCPASPVLDSGHAREGTVVGVGEGRVRSVIMSMAVCC